MIEFFFIKYFQFFEIANQANNKIFKNGSSCNLLLKLVVKIGIHALFKKLYRIFLTETSSTQIFAYQDKSNLELSVLFLDIDL